MSNNDALFKEFLEAGWVPNWDIHPVDSLLEMVIVEPRNHTYLPHVLRNMSSILPYASLTIFHSKENAHIIKDTVQPNGVNNIRMIPYFEGNIDRDSYSKMMMSPDFWRQLRAPKTLIFQVDSGMRHNRILRFMEYDYIGAPWVHQVTTNPSIFVGNGGFSLRTKKYMQEIVKIHPCQSTPDVLPEDVYFGINICNFDDVCLPSFEEASMFSLEYARHTNPMAFHQAYRFDIHPQSYLKDIFTNNLTCQRKPCAIKIVDAWIECQNGYICHSFDIVSWLQLGISTYGMHVPKDSYITCIEKDPLPGYKKYLRAKILVDNTDLRLYTIRLHRNRMEDDLII